MKKNTQMLEKICAYSMSGWSYNVCTDISNAQHDLTLRYINNSPTLVTLVTNS